MDSVVLGCLFKTGQTLGGSVGCVRKENQESLAYFMCFLIFLKVAVVEVEASEEM